MTSASQLERGLLRLRTDVLPDQVVAQPLDRTVYHDYHGRDDPGEGDSVRVNVVAEKPDEERSGGHAPSEATD